MGLLYEENLGSYRDVCKFNRNCYFECFFSHFFLLFQSVSDFYDAFHKGDYCNDVTKQIPQFGIIVGLLPLQGKAVYSTKSHRVTVVGSSTINNLTTLYIGTDDGYVIQVRLEIC